MEQYCTTLDDQLQIISLDQADSGEVLEFFKRTDKEFYDLTPDRSEDFYTKAFWNFEVDLAINRFQNQKKASFVILNCKYVSMIPLYDLEVHIQNSKKINRI